MLFEQRTRAESFGAVAELYDRVRPTYPRELIDTLLEGGAADRGATASANPVIGLEVLDVGCGTGIAAALLAARGCTMLGVEVDHRMAELARGKGLAVEEGAFERWDDRGRRFDLVISAQAWHWIDPRVGVPKVARVLRQRGQIAVFWNLGDPSTAVRERLAPIYHELEPELENYSVVLGGRSAGDRDALERSGSAARDLRESGLFDEITTREFPWQLTYTSAHWVGFLRTHSDHQVLPHDRRERLLTAVGEAIDELGGAFEVDYATILVSARRR